MAIQEGYKNNFETMRRAFKSDDVCLMECVDKRDGKRKVVVCMTNVVGEQIGMAPIAILFDENPYEVLEPPIAE